MRPRRSGMRRSRPSPRTRWRSPSSAGPTSASRALLNALLGEERSSSATSRVRRVTRSTPRSTGPVGRERPVDTAGIRRRGKVASGPAAERFATLRALEAVARADVAVLVLDAQDGLTAQDDHVAGYVARGGQRAGHRDQQVGSRARRTSTRSTSTSASIRSEAPFLDFAPIVSISAKTGQRVGRVLEAAVESPPSVAAASRRPQLNQLAAARPTLRQGRRCQGQAAADSSTRTQAADRSRRRSCCSPGEAGRGPFQLPALSGEPAPRGASASPARRSG